MTCFDTSLSRRRTVAAFIMLLAGIIVETQPVMLRAHGKVQGSKSASSRAPKNLYTRVWKSQTTSNEYRVELAGQTLRAEWINIPANLASHGAYIHTECHRVGTKWVGTSSSYLPHTTGNGPKEQVTNWCKLVTRTEIDTMSADRITGRAQGLKRFDCQRCTILEADWKDFVWVPAK